MLFANIVGLFCMPFNSDFRVTPLQKFQNNSPHNLREPLAYRSYPKCLRFTSVRVRIVLVLQECLEAPQNGDAFKYAVPPRMEEVLDSRHILIGSGRD
jgi:hypothetical protein